MSTTYKSLLVNDAKGWHDGTGTIYYSFLDTIPSYYDRLDTDGDSVYDYYDIDGSGTLTARDLPVTTTSVALSTDQRALAEKAISAWSAVANINLLAGNDDETLIPGYTPITGSGTLVNGLGGATGYGEIALPTNDDGFKDVDISSVFSDGLNFGGSTYSTIFVNTNGSISFSSGISTFTPSSITSGSTPMIAPFWADVDTRPNSEVDPGVDSQPIYVDLDQTNKVLTVTWADVGYYNQHADKTNSFQLQLYDRGSGNFDIVFRYEDINWTTGDRSDGVNGLGGVPAHAGYTLGDGTNYYELGQSGDESEILDLDETAGNTGVDGLWVFKVRNGAIAGDITFGAADFSNPNEDAFLSNYDTGTPGQPGTEGDIWINNANALQLAAAYGNFGWMNYLHELGHALGLQHPDNDPNNTADDPRNNNQWTVMSKILHPSQSGETDEDAAYPLTPMILDIQAIQKLYGANLETNKTATNYISGSNAQFALDSAGDIDGRTAIFTIWDAGGVDTLNASNQTTKVNINLTPGTYSSIGSSNNVGLASAVTVGGKIVNYIENAQGGNKSDKITGNDVSNRLYGNDGNDTLLGGAGSDSLYGGAGNDILDGGSYADTMYGGTGNDIYIVNSTSDVVSEAGGSGIDRVESTVSWTLGTGIENLVLKGSSRINGTGNSGDNRLTGNSASNILSGGVGDDILNGGGGNDTLYGGSGNDSYYIDSVNDRIVDASGTRDKIYSSFGISLQEDDSLPANVKLYKYRGSIEQLELTGSANNSAYGNELDNIVTGNSGNNVLRGFVGNDTLIGGAGNDTLVGGSGSDKLYGGAGYDMADYFDAKGSVTVNLSSVSNKSGYAKGDRFSSVENLRGSYYADDLTGTSGANTIYGGEGADTIHGGGGNDVIEGGLAADKLYGGTGADKFVFRRLSDSSGSKLDTIYDFTSSDKIDLHLIDAKEHTSGNQSFTFIQTHAFTGHAGEVRYVRLSSDTYIYADVDGDKSADLTIHLDDPVALKVGNFIL